MSLPEPYRSWFVAVVGAEPPDEPGATCHACPMCAARGFRSTVKCCTYAPAIPNFQAGAALKAGGEAAARIEARMLAGRSTEAWLLPAEQEDRAYDAERSAFGATRAVRCPYVTAQGRCSIHAHRNAICATWFCVHDRGEVGTALWDAATELFHHAEHAVAAWSSGDGYRVAARRAATLTWTDIRRIAGRELVALEQALVAAHGRWAMGGDP